jgi:glycosyltransferase involved in cell wall biosynthesis
VSVSVLIPTYQDAHLLRKSLPVLLKHPGEIEVVVVNNDPAQDVASALGEHTRVAPVTTSS